MPQILQPYIGQAERFRRHTATGTGTNGTGVQAWFPSGGSGVFVPADHILHVEGKLWLNKGTILHTLAHVLGGTATFTNIFLMVRHHILSPNNVSSGGNSCLVTQAASTVISGAVTTANEYCEVDGKIITNAAGTIIPQFAFSADPTGTISIGTGSYYDIWDMGPASETIRGNWS